MCKVTVTVAGKAGSGKSTIARMIQDMLEEYDLDCTVQDDDADANWAQDSRIVALQVRAGFEVEIRTVAVNAAPAVAITPAAQAAKPFRPTDPPIGSPNDPLPVDASPREVAAQLLAIWPDCVIETVDGVIERDPPRPDDLVRAVLDPLGVALVYSPESARSWVAAEGLPAGDAIGWWFVVKSDPGRLPAKVTTIAAAVAAEVFRG